MEKVNFSAETPLADRVRHQLKEYGAKSVQQLAHRLRVGEDAVRRLLTEGELADQVRTKEVKMKKKRGAKDANVVFELTEEALTQTARGGHLLVRYRGPETLCAFQTAALAKLKQR